MPAAGRHLITGMARLIDYTALDHGKNWQSDLIYKGEGTHEAIRVDLDGSGTHVILGHAAKCWARREGPI